VIVSPLADAAATVPRQPPLPPLLPENRPPVRAAECGEPLVEIDGPKIVVLHSYAKQGREHAVDRQWLRRGTLDRLNRAAANLPPRFGFAVWDAWRPIALQRELYESMLGTLGADIEVFVAPPNEDPDSPPPHVTGGTVDLTLTWDGVPLELGTAFDECVGATAAVAYETVPGPERDLRRLLYHTLRAQGFVVLAEEWWHFEYGTRLWSALTGRPPVYSPVSPASP
jgi:D-alanyl-D-alanine dipeptidase